MASIIEKYASQDITLLQNPVIADGKTTYKDRIDAKAIVSEFKEADEQYFGKIRNGITFYISPLDDPPQLPGKILCHGREYEIKGVRIYKNLSSKLPGYKAAAKAQ